MQLMKFRTSFTSEFFYIYNDVYLCIINYVYLIILQGHTVKYFERGALCQRTATRTLLTQNSIE